MKKLLSTVLTGVFAGTLWLLPSIQKQPSGTASANPYFLPQFAPPNSTSPYFRPFYDPFPVQPAPVTPPPFNQLAPFSSSPPPNYGVGGRLNILDAPPPSLPQYGPISPRVPGSNFGGRPLPGGAGGLGGYGGYGGYGGLRTPGGFRVFIP